MNAPRHRHSVGITRREALQVGYTGLLGIGLTSALTVHTSPSSAAAMKRRKPKSVILVYLSGGPSHIDTFDMKPDAPAEIRGEFKPIQTRLPGLVVCEHLPLLAARTDKYALVRTLSHPLSLHREGALHLLTGQPWTGPFQRPISRDDWPCYAAGLNYLRPRSDGLPSGVNLPAYMQQGPLAWPGQYAGFLGPNHDPWQINGDPNAPNFHVDSLRLNPAMDVDRLQGRQSLLEQMNRQQKSLAESAEGRRLSDQQERAFSLLTSGKIAQAFEMSREPAALRERYGRHTFGQSLLLARRLVQAGVPIVQVNDAVQSWDTHSNNFGAHKRELLPRLDRGVSALLDDMAATGLLDETLVLVLGEMGRTPKINFTVKPSAGRDHWAPCFFGLFAGAGVQGGQVIGASDKNAAYPTSTPYSPSDIGATVYHILGVDPASEVHDRLGRPVQLNRGKVMDCLFGGKS